MSGIWYLLRDADRYVYHYTRAQVAADIILPNETFRLSAFQSVNDPKENKHFRMNGIAWDSDFKPSALVDFARCLKQDWRIACFSRDPADAVFSLSDG